MDNLSSKHSAATRGIRPVGLLFLVAFVGLWIPRVSEATSPVQLPPCPEASLDHESNAALAAMLDPADGDQNKGWTAGCAAGALSRKNEDVVPTLLAIMELRHPESARLALQAVCGPGHHGSSAVPYLLARLDERDPMFDTEVYEKLVCMGQEAKPALPVLLQRSSETEQGRATLEAVSAIGTLGKLASIEPDVIIPHLTSLLNSPVFRSQAAEALQAVGPPARTAVPLLRAKAMELLPTGSAQDVAPFIDAITSIGPPGDDVDFLIPLLNRPSYASTAARDLGKLGEAARPALPKLIAGLRNQRLPRMDRLNYVAAISEIDLRSDSAVGALIQEATSDYNNMSVQWAAIALATIDPLPKTYASPLNRRIGQLPESSGVRFELIQALGHTHVGIAPAVAAPDAKPVPVSASVARAIVSLTEQGSPITFNQVLTRFEIDSAHYERETHSVARFREDGVSPDSPILQISMIGWPDSNEQELRIDFAGGYCVTAEAISLHDPESALRRINTGLSSIPAESKGDGLHPRVHHHAKNHELVAKVSTVNLESRCSRSLSIVKEFDRKKP